MIQIAGVPGMSYVALAGLDLDLVDLAVSCEGQQASAGDVCVSPVCEAQLDVVLRLESQCEPRPREQGLPLADDPVISAVQVDRDNARYGVFGRDERCDGASRRDFLVEKGNADGGSLEGLEDGEGGKRVFRLAAEADEGSAAGVEGL